LIVGYRGEPGKCDHEAHRIDGVVTKGALDLFGIDYSILWEKKKIEYVKKGISCLLVPMGLLEGEKRIERKSEGLSRREAIKCILENIEPGSKIVSSLGYLSRELYDLSEDHKDHFYCVGAMGHASMVAAEIARHTDKKVYLLDGDGSAIMHLGALTYIWSQKIENLFYIVFNNGCYDSVGGAPCIDFKPTLYYILSLDLLKKTIQEKKHNFIQLYIKPEAISCGRPVNLIDLKSQFMDGLK